MQIRAAKSSQAKIEQPMTPMIDVVFQLLTFFILSFKVVTAEGDFNLKMPLGSGGPGSPQKFSPLPLNSISKPTSKASLTACGSMRRSSRRATGEEFNRVYCRL